MLGEGVVCFFNDTATTEIYTLSLHDALPISGELGDEDFSGLRDYREGDSPRLIAWKHLARSDTQIGRAHV